MKKLRREIASLSKKVIDEFYNKGKQQVKRQHVQYIHLVYHLGWFRVSIYKLGVKFTIRLEITSGWN